MLRLLGMIEGGHLPTHNLGQSGSATFVYRIIEWGEGLGKEGGVFEIVETIFLGCV